MNMMYEVVVVKKDMKERRLEVFIKRFICYALHKHEMKSDRFFNMVKTLKNEEKANKRLMEVHKYNILGYIDYYDIVRTLLKLK